MQNGQDNLKISKSIPRTKTQWVLMEKQLKSSGKFSQVWQHRLLSRRSRWTWRGRTQSRKTLQTGSSLCRCSTTPSGKRIMRIAFRTPRKSRITRRLAGMSLAEWPTQPQTQVKSPASRTPPITRIWRTIWLTSPTTIQISGSQTTSPWFLAVIRIPKDWAAAVQPQQARFHFLIIPAHGNPELVMCQVDLTLGKMRYSWTENPLQQRFFCSLQREKRDRELNFVHLLTDWDDHQKDPWTESWLAHSGWEKRLSKNCIRLKRSKSGSFFSGDR